jgi:hypothetical protein
MFRSCSVQVDSLGESFITHTHTHTHTHRLTSVEDPTVSLDNDKDMIVRSLYILLRCTRATPGYFIIALSSFYHVSGLSRPHLYWASRTPWDHVLIKCKNLGKWRPIHAANMNKSASCFCTFLTEYHAMEAYWWSGGIVLHAFLTSALDGGEWSCSRPGHFTTKERAPGTHWIGDWVGTGRGGDEKNSQPSPGLEPPDHPARSPALYPLSYPVPEQIR